MKNYIKFLIKTRKEKKVSRRKLAEAIGCSERAIEYWETGKRIPSIELYEKAMKFLGAEYILGKED